MRFTEYFKINKNQFEVDFINIDLEKDYPLFVDPWLLAIDQSDLAEEAKKTLSSFFDKLIFLIRNGDKTLAIELLNFLHEPSETHLGYSQDTLGFAIGKIQSTQLYEALSKSKAVQSGFLKNIEDTALFVEGIDRDKISDIVTNIIRYHLIKYTQDQCRLLGIRTYKIRSGFYWDKQSTKWTTREEYLPVYKDSKILLVPKTFVSKQLSLNAYDFYNKEFLVFEQNLNLNAGTGLCRILKNGDIRPPSKKVLKKLKPFSKELLYEFANRNPESFQQYKKKLGKGNTSVRLRVLDSKTIVTISDEPSSLKLTASQLSKELILIRPGTSEADNFHNLTIGILSFLFEGQLKDPRKEDPTNEGRKRIDITMFNNANMGFFLNCSKLDIPCRKVFFECKNYNTEIANPEIDQLLGRFHINESKIGFLICRKIRNREIFVKRCRDAVLQNRNYIIGLDDEDILQLIEWKSQNLIDEIDNFLDARIEAINH